DDHLPDTCHSCRKHSHDHAAGVCRSSAGCIDADTVQRIRTSSHQYAWLGLQLVRLRKDRAVHGCNVSCGALQRTANIGTHEVERLTPAHSRHLQRLERYTIQLDGKLTKSSVSALSNPGHDAFRAFAHDRNRRERAIEQGAPTGVIERSYRPAEAKERTARQVGFAT